MLVIRTETSNDYKTIFEVNEMAFNQNDESRIIERIRKSKNFLPELSLVAEENGEIVGHILFSKIIIKGKQEFDTLALAPMAVIPGKQRQGIGKALVWTGLERAVELGFDSVIVLGHHDYYPKFGFEKASKWSIYCPFNVPDEAFMAIELIEGALKNKTGTVQYPEEFGM